MSVRPRSSTSTGPPVVSTEGMSGNLPPAGLGPLCLGARVAQHAEHDTGRRDAESDGETYEQRAVDALARGSLQRQQERKSERQPLPDPRRRITEAEAGEEEEEIGDDGHRNVRGSQDSNLEPPVLETGTLAVELLPPTADSRRPRPVGPPSRYANICSPMRRRSSRDFEAAMALMQAGSGDSKIARITGIPPATLSAWRHGRGSRLHRRVSSATSAWRPEYPRRIAICLAHTSAMAASMSNPRAQRAWSSFSTRAIQASSPRSRRPSAACCPKPPCVATL